jgi:hypothetical protein
MPLFGYPVAQENDVERAVRVALVHCAANSSNGKVGAFISMIRNKAAGVIADAKPRPWN